MRFRVRPVDRLAGTAEVPGDKSISHRAALLGALADGVTEIHGYLEAEDCLRTIAAVQALGAEVTRKGPGHYRIAGAGRYGLQEPGDVHRQRAGIDGLADVIGCSSKNSAVDYAAGRRFDGAGQPDGESRTAVCGKRDRDVAPMQDDDLAADV